MSLPARRVSLAKTSLYVKRHHQTYDKSFTDHFRTTGLPCCKHSHICDIREDNDSHECRYFKARNGTYKRVPQIPNSGFNGVNGGMTVYYMQDGLYNFQQVSKVQAFQPVSLTAPVELLFLISTRASACSSATSTPARKPKPNVSDN
jgi:hypothetical protein